MKKMNIWDQLTKAVVFLLVGAALLAVCVWYLPLIRQNERMRKEVLKMDVRIQKAEELNRSLRAAVDASHNDARTIERLARTHLGYARTGEIVVRFEAPPPPSPTSAPIGRGTNSSMVTNLLVPVGASRR
jgi:hypothetical protein